jgi:hypothetical protein
MEQVSLTTIKKPRKYSIIDRLKQAEAARQVIDGNRTQQNVANEYGVSRDAVQEWVSRSKGRQKHVDQKIAIFYESPEGFAHLRRILVSACLVFHTTGGCGLPLLQKFLELSKLNTFVGSSIGILHKMSSQLDKKIIEFGKQEKERLAKDMPLKEMTAAVDENFMLQNMTLILMDPDSGFILAEQQEDKRDAATWMKVSQTATSGLNVKIVQVTGDEASGIAKFTIELLGAKKSSDLFHVQQDITKGLTSILARKVQQAEIALKNAIEQKQMQLEKLKTVAQNTGATLDAPNPQIVKISKRLLKEGSNEQKCQQKLAEVKQDYQAAQNARRTITTNYHPYNLITGDNRAPEQLKQELEAAHATLEQISKHVDSTDGQKKKLGKAKAAIESMVQTLAFFFLYLQQVVRGLNLDEQGREAFESLVSIEYIKMALKRCTDKNQKTIISETLSRLTAHQRDGPWRCLSQNEQMIWEKKARQCAALFQRSSSCVEGRNGVLSLKHHALHRLNVNKLQALTVLHNFFSSRREGTTAAERFFENQQRDLFEWLLGVVDLPVRPRNRAKLWTQKAPENQAA